MAKTVRKELVTKYSIDATKALRDLGALRKSSAATAKATNQLSASVNRLGTSLKALAGLSTIYLAFNGLSELTRAVSEVQTLDTVLRGATGSVEAFDQSLEFLTNVSDEFGLSLRSLQSDYAPFIASAQGAGLTLQQSEEAFRGVTVAAAAFRLSAADLEGAMLGLQQLVNSTNVNLEDLRQITDRLPGGMKAATLAAAELTGQTELTTGEFKKLVSDGLLPAGEYVPILAAELEKMNLSAAAENANTYGASLERLDNAFLELFRVIGETGVLDEMGQGVDAVASSLEYLETPIRIVINSLVALFDLAGSVGSVLGDLASSIGRTMGNISDSLVGVFSEGKADAIDYGNFIGYMFEVTLPTEIDKFGAFVQVTWEEIKASAAITVAYLTEIWPRVKIAGLEAFSLLATGAYNTMYDMADAVLRVLTNMVNKFKSLLNLAIEGVNALGADFEPFSIEPFKGLTREFNNFGEAAKAANAEYSALQKTNASVVEEAYASVDAIKAETSALVETNKLKREDARITDDLDKSTKLITASTDDFADSLGGGVGGGGGGGVAGSAAKAAKELERLRDAYISILERAYPAIAAANKHADEVLKVNLAYQAGAITLEEFNKGLKLSSEYMGETQKKLVDTEEELSVFEDALKNIGDDLANVFSDLFSGGIESAEDFVKELKDVLISGIKNIIGDLAKQSFKVAISAVINTTTGAVTSTGGASGDSGGFSLGSLSKLFSGNGLGEGISKGLTAGFDKLGIEIGDTLGKGLENIAATSSLALAGGSILGGLAGSLLFEGTTASIGSSIGSTAGSIIGASIVGGPIGAIAGGLLGGVGGGFLGSLFGEDDRVPYAQFRVEGGGIRGAGGWGLDEDDMAAAEEYIQSLHDVLTAAGELLGPEAQIARFEFNRAASEEMDPAYIEDYLLGTSREILQAMVDAVPGQLGQLYGAVLNAAGSKFEDVVAALEGISVYITNFAVAIDAIKPGALTNVEDIAGAINQIALADVPAVTAGLVTLAALMESFKTPAEKAADAQARVNAVFEQAGIAVPKTIKEFRALIAALDLTTADGLYASQAISTVAADLQLLLQASEGASAAVSKLGGEISSIEDFIKSLRPEADRNSAALNVMSELFSSWGLQMPSTSEDLYDLIQAGAFTAEQLQILTDSSEQLGFAFSALDQILADEIDDLKEASAARIDILRSESKEAISLIRAQQQARIDGLNAEKDAINKRISDIRDSISGLQSIIDSARKAIFNLSGQAAFGVEENRQRLLELAREAVAAGELPDNAGDIISGLGSVNANDFATREEYLRAVEENQTVLDELAKLGEGQLSEGERQIELLKNQIDQIDDQIDAIKYQTDRLIATEEKALKALIAAEEAALKEQTGSLQLSNQLILDVLERIYGTLTEETGQWSPDPFPDSTPQPLGPASFAQASSAAPTDSEDSKALLASIAATNREMAKLLKRWNGEGLPADRDDYLLTISENTAPTGNATP